MPNFMLTRFPVYAQDLEVTAYFLRTDSNALTTAESDPAHVLLSALTRSDIRPEGEERPFFVALPASLLQPEYLSLLPKEQFHIAIDDAELNDASIETLLAYAQKGYRFGITRFRYRPETRRVLFAAKYLFVAADNGDAEIKKVVAEAKRMALPVIATGIEDHESLKRVRTLKVDGYMGSFLTKPDLFNPVKVSSNRLVVYRLLEALSDPDVSFDVLENLLVQDNRLSYKLLKVLNSPTYAVAGRKITSIRDIIVMLGLDQLRSWATLIALTNIEDKPYELMVTTMLRARMAQSMAEALGVESPESAFMAGLLSTLDALLDREMVDVLSELPVAPVLKDALLQQAGPIGAVLRDVFNYERGDWATLSGSLLSRDDYRRCYTESVIWASKLCATLSA